MPTVLDIFRPKSARTDAEQRSLTKDSVPSVMLHQTVAGSTVNAEAALRIVDAYACVRLLAETASTLPLIPYRRTSNGRTRLDGRLAELLTRPSPGNTQANLVSQLVGSLALRGNAYLGKFRNGGGEIEQLALLPPERVTVELKGGVPLYTLTSDKGAQTTHTARDVLHLKGLSADGIVGLSPIAQCREALGLARTLGEHASATFGNSALPQGVLSVGGQGPQQADLMERLKAAWETRHGGARNAGRVAVVSGEITFSPLSLTPADAQFIEQRRLSTQEVARIFRVPAHMVGGESQNSLTYSTVEMDALNFARFSLQPLLTIIEQGITADTDLCLPRCYCEFLLDGLLRADSQTRANVYAQALDPERGWMRREEVRRLENLEPETTPDRREAAA